MALENLHERLEEAFQKDSLSDMISFPDYLELWKRVTRVFQDTFDDESLVIYPQTTANDIDDWDSVTNIQLLVAVEKEFAGVKFNTGEIASLKDVGEMVNVILKRVSR